MMAAQQVDVLKSNMPVGVEDGTSVEDIHNAIDTFAARTSPSIKGFGAIGDGVSHPLSASFGSLAAAQAVYPKVTDLNQELDWAALQKAIDTVGASGGGTVYAPPGTYLMGNGYVQFPECRPYGTQGTQVNLLGSGEYVTTFKWQTDRGAGKFAMGCGPETATRANETGLGGLPSWLMMVPMELRVLPA